MMILPERVAEVLDRSLGCRPGRRKDDDFGASSGIGRCAEPLLGQPAVFRVGRIGYAENYLLATGQPSTSERRSHIAGTNYDDRHQHLRLRQIGVE